MYEKVKNLKTAHFKRLCGVRPETFSQMVKIVKTYFKLNKRTGRPRKLAIEDQVLMTLEYWREYRTYFHMGQTWGLHESTVYRIIREIENILIKSKEFRLTGKKQLRKSDISLEIVVVDVTEVSIERPKKNQKSYYSGKKKDIL